jgi:uncharacterized membrane protein HdeD (DUF308 family)
LGSCSASAAFIAPGPTLVSLALLFGAYLLVDGVFGIIAAVKAASRNQRWGLLLLEAVANIVMGVIAVVFPLGAVLAFVLVTAGWALLTGGLMVGAAFRLDALHGRWWLVLSGVVSVIFGVLLLVSPLVGAVVLTWWLGAYALVFGAMLLGSPSSSRDGATPAPGGCRTRPRPARAERGPPASESPSFQGQGERPRARKTRWCNPRALVAHCGRMARRPSGRSGVFESHESSVVWLPASETHPVRRGRGGPHRRALRPMVVRRTPALPAGARRDPAAIATLPPAP